MVVPGFPRWRARGFRPVTVENDIGLLERTLTALGRPAWDVTPEDIDRVFGDLALAGRAASTGREYVQIFKGFHRFLPGRKCPPPRCLHCSAKSPSR